MNGEDVQDVVMSIRKSLDADGMKTPLSRAWNLMSDADKAGQFITWMTAALHDASVKAGE